MQIYEFKYPGGTVFMSPDQHESKILQVIAKFNAIEVHNKEGVHYKFNSYPDVQACELEISNIGKEPV